MRRQIAKLCLKLKEAFGELRDALKTNITSNEHDILKVLEIYFKNDFTARINDEGVIAKGIDALGDKIADMLKITKRSPNH